MSDAGSLRLASKDLPFNRKMLGQDIREATICIWGNFQHFYQAIEYGAVKTPEK